MFGEGGGMGNRFVSSLVWRVSRRLFYLAVMLVMWGVSYLLIFGYYDKYWSKWIAEDVSGGFRNLGFLVAVFLALGFVWSRFRHDFREDQFDKAVVQLASPEVLVKLSVIPQLTEIALEDPKRYFGRAVAVLCDQTRSYHPYISPNDVAAVRQTMLLDVEGRGLEHKYENVLRERRDAMRREVISSLLDALSRLLRESFPVEWEINRNNNLQVIELSDIIISEFNFDGDALTGTIFRNVKFENCNFFDGFSGRRAFENCQFETCSFWDAEIKHVGFLQTKFNECDFTRVLFSECTFQEVEFSNTKIGYTEDSIFNRCEMSDVQFECTSGARSDNQMGGVSPDTRGHFIPEDFDQCFTMSDREAPTGLDQMSLELNLERKQLSGDKQPFFVTYRVN
ncbi:MAG: pentapeptide repeat-containing protein [Parvibaculaceae bacterium]|nr:pentapeptide repeat-containing protein [Parvibaculaceae bacterium]